MKPKDLKSVFTFEQRHPCLQDRVLYVPFHYQEHATFAIPPFFEHDRPLCVEYCSGNGDWIVQKAKSFPNKNWIAVEKRYDRVKKIWAKMKNEGLDNVLIVSGEALTFTTHYLNQHVVDEIYINFPDPWPKGKHAKHRLMQPLFIEQMIRVLKEGKSITLATDDFVYLSKTLAHMSSSHHFKPLFEAPHYIQDDPDYGDSWFANLWRSKGRSLYFTTFIKRLSDASTI